MCKSFERKREREREKCKDEEKMHRYNDHNYNSYQSYPSLFLVIFPPPSSSFPPFLSIFLFFPLLFLFIPPYSTFITPYSSSSFPHYTIPFLTLLILPPSHTPYLSFSSSLLYFSIYLYLFHPFSTLFILPLLALITPYYSCTSFLIPFSTLLIFPPYPTSSTPLYSLPSLSSMPIDRSIALTIVLYCHLILFMSD